MGAKSDPMHSQALTAAPLQNGDVVIVQAAQPNTIFIGGLVMSPHAQVNPPGTKMSALQALASADVIPTEITLIRRMPDGKDVHVKLNADRIQHGQGPNAEQYPEPVAQGSAIIALATRAVQQP